jgi:hypothetical protein
MDPGFRREANRGKARHADAPAAWGFPFIVIARERSDEAISLG